MLKSKAAETVRVLAQLRQHSLIIINTGASLDHCIFDLTHLLKLVFEPAVLELFS